MEFPGGALTKLPPTIKTDNEPYVTHIQRTIKCAVRHYGKQIADIGYITHIVNTYSNPTAQQQIDRVRTPDILEGRECQQ